ncbi:hypothetical protein RJT34_13935 [Clitoria ternatea]|uniref:Uncharacterized protein n=1 Tax=Clitoria ternatea TaxID=43366 RepID=A0AAN9PLY5_CLITE
MAVEAKTWLVLSLVFLAASCMQHFVYGEPRVPCLFIFGDSLSDSGNNNHLPTTAKCNYRPYGIDFPTGPTGRFTNGRTTIDIITQFLGFENFIPPFANTSGSDILKGVNYASGGAGIRAETGAHSGGTISLRWQLANHRVIVSQIANRLGSPEKAQQYFEKCLYPLKFSVSQMIRKTILAHHVNMKSNENVTGCTPNAIYTRGENGSCVEEMNAVPFIFNKGLKSLVDSLNNKFSANSKFTFIKRSSQAIDSRGFLVSKAACCSSGLHRGCVPDQIPCCDRNEYVFWDEFHPTEAWNLHIAIASYNNSAHTYPMNIKQLVDHEIKMELEFTNESIPQLSATK